MPVVDACGMRGNVVLGRGERVAGQENLVFIHGVGGDWSSWYQQRNYFSRAFNVFIMELPGHGAARGTGAREIKDYALWIKGALDQLQVTSPFVIGHSMGGAITMDLALRYPDLPQGLVLVSTGARLRVLPDILEAIAKDFPHAVTMICKLSFAQDVPPPMLQAAVAAMLKNTPDILLGDFSACEGFDIMEKVQAIGIPTLVICGHRDALTPIKYSRYLADKIAGSALEIVAGAGHLVMMERPEEFNKKVEMFLNAVRGKDA
jgi:pimeloyl-ACP methyl ester carboxylesterase